MRGLLTNVAVLGVLALAGVPVLSGTLTGDETTPAAPEQATTEDSSAGPPTGPPTGPPGAAGHEKNADKRADKAAAKQDREQTREDDVERGGPPPWAAAKGHGSTPGAGRDHQARSPHGWAVREWAHCLAGAARDLEPGEKLEPATACGGRPVPPGHVRKGTRPGKPDGSPGQRKSQAPGPRD